jgi:hypothetical protein
MTVESVERAVFVAVQAALPPAITAANLTYGDGVLIPTVATWYQGIMVNVSESDPERLPSVSVGTYRDDPVDPGENAQWGSIVQRPVVVGFVMLGADGPTVHLRTIRLVDVIKRVMRGLVPTLSGDEMMYLPYDLNGDWEPPRPFGVADLDFTTSIIEAGTLRVVEEASS